MEKSLEFVKKRIATGECNGMENNKWKRLDEVSFIDVLNNDLTNLKYCPLPKTINYTVNNNEFSLTIKYDYEAEFQYFITKQCICDGTLLFELENMYNVILKIINLETFYSPIIPEDFEEFPWRYDLIYTVGNFVSGMEIDNEFAPKDKPYMTCRFTAMLPIKMEFVRNSNE